MLNVSKSIRNKVIRIENDIIDKQKNFAYMQSEKDEYKLLYEKEREKAFQLINANDDLEKDAQERFRLEKLATELQQKLHNYTNYLNEADKKLALAKAEIYKLE